MIRMLPKGTIVIVNAIGILDNSFHQYYIQTTIDWYVEEYENMLCLTDSRAAEDCCSFCIVTDDTYLSIHCKPDKYTTMV